MATRSVYSTRNSVTVANPNHNNFLSSSTEPNLIIDFQTCKLSDLSRSVHFWLDYTFQLNLYLVQQKPVCHFHLCNPLDAQERHITDHKWDIVVQGHRGYHPLPALTEEAGTELAPPSSKET
ncbi:hypothetical protein J6590_042127 [Homalodisca vitripennis]|nr:hypothetical protein J6590_042127 [Homalodisca vitripennis]